MLEEQQKTIQTFRKAFFPDRMEKFVIYGTGINAEAIVKECSEYPIVGLMDASKTGQVLWGLRVLSEEEVERENVHLVVVVARPAVHGIIYKRIQRWSQHAGIVILDIQGRRIADMVKVRKCESTYFNVSWESLLREIDKHEVITFDIFDTLLIRKVYAPEDVFVLLNQEYAEQYPFVFSEERKCAEQELLGHGCPTIDQIYEQLRKNNPCVSIQESKKMLRKELEKEMQVLMPRKRMLECIKYCKSQGKRIFLVSDMYLPKEILSEWLKYFGIIYYEKLFVSCDYGVSKENGLFWRVKDYLKNGETCLHIGDNEKADGKAAQEAGMDVFLIQSPVRMMELSACAPLLSKNIGLESRVMLGLLASKLFEDPFVLYQSEGKPLLTESRNFGFVFIAPLAISLVVWMLKQTENKGQDVLLFSARDGWLMQKLYCQLADAFSIKDRPEDLYLLISRKAVTDLKEDKKQNYLNYVSTLNLDTYANIFFFDFMSKGTCQYFFEQLIHRSCLGLYFQKSESKDTGKENLKVKSYAKEKNAQNTGRRFFAVCDFLECIFTSFEPSFLKFTSDGRAVYERERRTKEQIICVREIQDGILEYAMHFSVILGRKPKAMPSIDFCDEILEYMSASYSNIQISELKEMILDDFVFGDKNTGVDALM